MLSLSKAISKIVRASLTVLFIGWFSAVSQAAEVGIVVVHKLNMRSEPDRKASSIQIIGQGTRVRILKHINGWLEIDHEGQTGYIRNRPRYVRIIKEDDQQPSQPENADRNVQAAQKESKDIQKEIEKREADVKAFSEKETTLINGLDDIDITLSKAHKRASEYSSDLTVLEGQIMETTRTVKALLKSIESAEAYVAKRLVALYKMNALGRMQILASADSMYEFFLRKGSLERILAHDVAVQKSLLEKKALLAELLKKLNAKKAEGISLQEKIQGQIEFMSQEREKRRRLLEEIRSQKSLELAAIESLKQAAEKLDKTIKSFETELKYVPEPKKISLQKRFSALKGVLRRPVNGKVVSRFGPYTDSKYNLKGFHNGIYIQADRGEPIHAVTGGRVVYSSWFKGYGNLIIIDHGNSYHTVYAHAEELFKSKGDVVEANDVIATVGDSGSMAGYRLYFEIRHRGKPLDPLHWIERG